MCMVWSCVWCGHVYSVIMCIVWSCVWCGHVYSVVMCMVWSCVWCESHHTHDHTIHMISDVWCESHHTSLTREMQGIVGQASDFVEVVSKIDWTLLHEIWWRKIEKIKGDWRATLWYVFFFAWTHQPTHEFDCRTSSGWRYLWGTHVGGRTRTRYRVGPGLRLPMRKKENVEERLNTTLQSFAASTELECERQE